jgi:hypothetical protein
VKIRSTHRPLVVSLTNVSSIPWAHLHLLARVHRHPLTRTIEPLSGEPCGTLIRRSGSPSCDTRRAFNYGMMDIVACQFVNYSRRCYRRCSTLLPTDRAIFGERISFAFDLLALALRLPSLSRRYPLSTCRQLTRALYEAFFNLFGHVIGSDPMTHLGEMYIGKASCEISSQLRTRLYIPTYNRIRLADILPFARPSRITCLRLIRHSARYAREKRPAIRYQFAASPFLVS